MADNLRLAGCVLTDHTGAVLLIHRNHRGRIQWEIPGGKIDSGESETDTVIRESNEELGTGIKILKRLGDQEFKEDGYTMHYTWFLAEAVGGAPKIGEPDKYDNIGYFSQQQLQDLRAELSPNTVNFLDAWANGRVSI
jgi:8-oxo-dGTP diphosphatase